MGRKLLPKLDCAGLIDVSEDNHPDFLDVFLLAKCQFALVSGSGPNSIPVVFGTPSIWTNNFPWIPAPLDSDLVLYKRVKEENPDASGLDRATKMSKLVKKTELNKISQEEIDPIYQYLIEKAENPESEKKNKKSKKKKSKKAESTESDSESLASGESTISENMTEQAYLTLASDLSQY